MDEPSAVLDNEEVERLFGVIRDLTAHDVAVVYISHRLEEIRQIGDRITVLKDGRTVATGLPARETPTREVITLMTGRTIEYVFPRAGQAAPPTGEPLLEVEGLGPARARSPASASPCARARSSAWPAWWAPAAPRSSRPSTAPAAPTSGHRPPRPASGCDPATSAPRWPPASGSHRRSARARRCCSTTRSTATSRISSLGRFARGGFLSGRRREGRGPRPDRVAGRPSGRRDRGSCGRCPAATSRRSCWPAGCCATAGCCCSTSPPAASTSAPARRSTPSSATSPTAGSPSSWSPARSRRCSAWPTACWSSPTAPSSPRRPADALDEHRVLDLIMEGTPHPGAAATATQHEGDVA